MSRRPTATSTCVLCQWRARMTDDTIVEVAEFLQRRLIEHLRECHPDHKIFGNLPVIIHTKEEGS